MLIALLNDTHCGVRNSSKIFMDYQERFYSEIFFPYCDANDIRHILHLGDYYDHRKNINFHALNHNRKVFLEPLVSRNMTMDIIPGNHDVFYKNSNHLCSLKELLGWFKENVNIIMEPEVLNYDGLDVAVLPWINSSNYNNSIEFINNCNAPIMAAHLELKGFEVSKGIINPYGMNASLFSKFEQVISGHFHIASEQGNIRYLGSQMEFSWSDCNEKKYFHILDTETREITKVLNPLTMYEIIRYDDSKHVYNDISRFKDKFVKIFVGKKDNQLMFDTLVDSLNDIGVHDLKISETFLNDIENVDISEGISDTGELLNTYIDAIDTQLDKERIKDIIHGLYVDAQSMEIR